MNPREEARTHPNVLAWGYEAQIGADAASDVWEPKLYQLAKDVLSLAETAGVPDTFYATDQRLLRAKEALASIETFRYDQTREEGR